MKNATSVTVHNQLELETVKGLHSSCFPSPLLQMGATIEQRIFCDKLAIIPVLPSD